jgi:hypothetical protein
VCHEQSVMLADDGSGFAREVSRLLASAELRQRLAAAGRLLLEKEFTWEAAWKNLDF